MKQRHKLLISTELTDSDRKYQIKILSSLSLSLCEHALNTWPAQLSDSEYESDVTNNWVMLVSIELFTLSDVNIKGKFRVRFYNRSVGTNPWALPYFVPYI